MAYLFVEHIDFSTSFASLFTNRNCAIIDPHTNIMLFTPMALLYFGLLLSSANPSLRISHDIKRLFFFFVFFFTTTIQVLNKYGLSPKRCPWY